VPPNFQHENAANLPLDDKKAKHSLTVVTMSAFRRDVLAAVIPRLCFIGFSFAQPFLINRVIRFVGEADDDDRMGVMGGLIGATALTYISIAVCLPGMGGRTTVC
jgi:ATP-binding cassette, subfamily C (CFTR/MRP), member 1